MKNPNSVFNVMLMSIKQGGSDSEVSTKFKVSADLTVNCYTKL